MPQNSSNVYIETNAPVPMPGGINTKVEYEIATADNIGVSNIPVVYKCIKEPKHSAENIYIEYKVPEDINKLFTQVPAEFRLYDPNIKSEDVYIDYTIPEYIDDSIVDVYVEFSNKATLISGIYSVFVNYIAGQLYGYFTQVPVDFSVGTLGSGYVATKVNYSNFTGAFTASGTPIDVFNRHLDIPVVFNMPNTPGSGTIDTIVDITFAGWVPNHKDFDCICSHIDTDYRRYELEVIAGGNQNIDVDLYSTNLTVSGINTSMICSLVDYAELPIHMSTISGSCDNIDTNIISSVENKQSIGIEIDLFPIEIRNFSLNIGDYITNSGTISVDVLDCINDISVSGTKVYIDDIVSNITYSGIDCGYRLFYDLNDIPPNSNTIEFKVYAENNINQHLIKKYYLTLGYIVEYDNHNDIDYGYKTQVPVRISVENEESCPLFDAYSYWFESRSLYNNDLGAYINGISDYKYKNIKSLSSILIPYNIYYEYGKEFEIEINIKDYDGNSMEPFKFNYKIEDKP